MRAYSVGFAWLLTACAHHVYEQQPCAEVGFAIASRTAECEEDDALGVERYDAFERSYTCAIPEDGFPPEVLGEGQVIGLYECAFVLRNLACELVLEYGDDLEAWMASSDACPFILDPA